MKAPDWFSYEHVTNVMFSTSASRFIARKRDPDNQLPRAKREAKGVLVKMPSRATREAERVLLNLAPRAKREAKGFFVNLVKGGWL